ncbi:MAG: pyruvate, phosphate dikinase, partial [Firmicutes bacterium]|nr:pyruvate, phosphate dikinase [Bacillota bacterium]
MIRYVFRFEEGRGDQKNLLGGKGAGLAEMSRIGLPVPPGFTITTQACNEYQETGQYPPGMMDQVWQHLAMLEESLGKRLGDIEQPLLVSVRSGAPISMPGMMDTVLNLGLNPETTEGLAKLTDNRRFAFDSYRRFIQMFGNVVMHMEHHRFEQVLADLKSEVGVAQDPDLTPEHLESLVDRYLALVKATTG